MKLTKYDKQGITRAIMNDVPRVDEDTRIKDVQEKLVAAMSKEARALYKLRPMALASQYISSYKINTERRCHTFVIGDADVEKVLAPFEAEYEARRRAHAKLEAAINACTTVKQLNDRLPEFKKYFPTTAQPAKYPLAAMDVAADLCKLGWPKK